MHSCLKRPSDRGGGCKSKFSSLHFLFRAELTTGGGDANRFFFVAFRSTAEVQQAAGVNKSLSCTPVRRSFGVLRAPPSGGLLVVLRGCKPRGDVHTPTGVLGGCKKIPDKRI